MTTMPLDFLMLEHLCANCHETTEHEVEIKFADGEHTVFRLGDQSKDEMAAGERLNDDEELHSEGGYAYCKACGQCTFVDVAIENRRTFVRVVFGRADN